MDSYFLEARLPKTTHDLWCVCVYAMCVSCVCCSNWVVCTLGAPACCCFSPYDVQWQWLILSCDLLRVWLLTLDLNLSAASVYCVATDRNYFARTRILGCRETSSTRCTQSLMVMNPFRMHAWQQHQSNWILSSKCSTSFLCYFFLSIDSITHSLSSEMHQNMIRTKMAVSVSSKVHFLVTNEIFASQKVYIPPNSALLSISIDVRITKHNIDSPTKIRIEFGSTNDQNPPKKE